MATTTTSTGLPAGTVATTAGPVTARRVRFGMRARVTIAFAFAGFVVSLGLSLITYFGTRSYLLDQQDTVARQQAFLAAGYLRDVLRNPDVAIPEEFNLLQTEGISLLEVGGQWYRENVGFTEDALPPRLLGSVEAGQSGRQWYSRGGDPYLAVGVAMPGVTAAYFEVFSASSLERTLGVIGTSLTIGSIVTTMVAAAVGWWASREVLKPVRRVADAASEIATGGLDTRLRPEADPDLDRVARSFNEMADAVQDRIEREVRFASDVSHELRSPITALTAAVEVLDSRRDDLPPRSQQALDVVTSQVRRFDQMVLDLLEISRLDAGAAELNTEEVMLGDVVRRIAVRYGAEHVPVVVASPFDVEPVEVDKRRLERILANLIGNADHHAGGATCIAVERGPRDRVRLVVEDAGPGVAAADKERVFERFARGTTARHRVGTGLGLALVQEHAQLHGGRAWVEDRRGGGSRFVVELPRSRR